MWKPVLHNEDEIADFVGQVSVDEICTDTVRELYFDSHATLERVAISDIVPGDEDHHIACPKKEARYASLHSTTRPPVLLNFDKKLADGNHRYRDAIARGETHLWAYVPAEGRLAVPAHVCNQKMTVSEGSFER